MSNLVKCAKHALAVALVAVGGISSASSFAATIGFSFTDDPNDYSYGRTHVGGTVTGFLIGLQDTGSNQRPTAVQITSDLSWLGMTDTLIDGDNGLWFWDSTGLNLTNGVVIGGGFGLNFSDPVIGSLQFRLNSQYGENMNILHWNGGSGPRNAIGNTDGFSGATYTTAASVPEPASLGLLGLGLAGLAVARRKQKSAT